MIKQVREFSIDGRRRYFVALRGPTALAAVMLASLVGYSWSDWALARSNFVARTNLEFAQATTPPATSAPRQSTDNRSTSGRSTDNRSTPGRSTDTRSAPGRSTDNRSTPGRSGDSEPRGTSGNPYEVR